MITSAYLNSLQIHGAANGINLQKYARKLSPRLDRISRGRQHGSVDFTAYHDGQVFDLAGLVNFATSPGSNQVEGALDSVRAQCWFDSPLTFKLQRSGIAVAEQSLVVCTVVDMPMEPRNKDWAPFALEFFSSDPRLYSQTVSSVSATAAAGVVNLTPTPGGNVKTPPTWTITGPVTNPSILNSATGHNIVLVATVASGHTLVIDALAKTVKLDGATEHPEYVDAVNTYWDDLAVGANTVQLTGTAMTNGTTALQAQWRDARG